MNTLIMTFCLAAFCWVAVPGSVYSESISAEDFDAAVEAAVAAAVAEATDGLAKKEDMEAVQNRMVALETSAEAAAGTVQCLHRTILRRL